jgi:PA domain-containing protein/flagellar hook capping protein FlgD
MISRMRHAGSTASRLAVALLAAILFVALPSAGRATATITIVNLDGAGEGFNDPAPRAPVGGNPGTTLGAQRLNVFQHAAAIWGGILSSAVEIRVEANFDPQFCTATSAVLGSAGPITVDKDFSGAEFANTWYCAALVNKLAGSDLAPSDDDIGATFNSDVDNPVCLGTRSWYYGFDGNEGTDIELLPVVLHEIGHGLGFLTLADGSNGTEFMGSPDVFERYMLDITTGKHWYQMTNAERLASATNDGKLVWDGPAVTFKAPLTLGPRPKLVVNAPGAIAGPMLMGRASFGAALSTPGLTRAVVLADDGSGTTSDACTALVNAAAVSGKIALVDRSANCTDLVRAQNVQAAGAAGILIADNAASATPPTLRGTDGTLTVTAGGVRQADGNTIRAQLGAGVNVTMTVDPAKLSGADDNHHPLLFAPSPLQGGSSLSHWDVQAFPDLLMEPAINTSLHDNVDLAREAFEDIGWLPRVTAVDPAGPPTVRLPDNIPNPFVAATTIHFALERGGNGDLSIFDVSGRLIRHLAQGWLEAGSHALVWDGTDSQGRAVSPGVYLYRLTAGGFAGARHMVMVR